MRSINAVAAVIALQALAGCGMPAGSGAAHFEPPEWQKAEFAAREARSRIAFRNQVEAGTLGLAQLFPGGKPVDARHFRPLPPPSAVPIPAVPLIVAGPGSSEMPVQVALAVARGRSGGCVYKPIMSDADIDACR